MLTLLKQDKISRMRAKLGMDVKSELLIKVIAIATTFNNGLNMPVACLGMTLVIKLPSVFTKNSYLFASHEYFITENGRPKSKKQQRGSVRRSVPHLVRRNAA